MSVPLVYHSVAGDVICRRKWLSDAECIEHLSFWSKVRSDALDSGDKLDFDASIVLSRQLRAAMDHASDWRAAGGYGTYHFGRQKARAA